LGVSPELYQIAVLPNRVPAPDAAALGARLLREKRLSADNTVFCDTCHDVDKGFTDHRPDNATSAGVGGPHGTRNAPTVLNALFQASQFWDGRAATLEDQAKLPILNPVEMGQKTPENVVAKLRTLPEYTPDFPTDLRSSTNLRRPRLGDRRVRAHTIFRQLALRPVHGG
jgi:cytochrome c peroxidase